MKEITILRVNNGWIIRPVWHANRDMGPDPEQTKVARTVDDLSDIICQWAER